MLDVSTQTDFDNEPIDIDDDILDSDSEDSIEFSFFENLEQEEQNELQDSINDLYSDYLDNYSVKMSNPTFIRDSMEDIAFLLFQDLLDAKICVDADYEYIYSFVEECVTDYITIYEIPQRSENHILTPIYKHTSVEEVIAWIQELAEIPQPAQRTAEWYEFRNQIMTASNIWKIFASDAQRNSLIYEKCRTNGPIQNEYTVVNTDSPLHWGVKYEPLTVMLYEDKNGVKIGDYGCIQHPTIRCIGASPDGIVVSSKSTKGDGLVGRMIEIKNIVNRDIDIPSEAYWVQMQLQMECCNLEACDFIETRFKEYLSVDEFFSEADTSVTRGVILHFVNNKSVTESRMPYYQYMPIDIGLNPGAIEKWIIKKKSELCENYGLYKTIYWYLDEYSCLTVKRNPMWFNAALPIILETWSVIEKERKDGCEHRAAKKKKPVITLDAFLRDDSIPENIHIIQNIPKNESVCLIKLNPQEIEDEDEDEDIRNGL